MRYSRPPVTWIAGSLPVSGDGKHVDAYNLLLQSRFFGRRGSDGDEQRALEYVQQAVALDPGYALAWARLSANYDTRDPRARTAAQRALEVLNRFHRYRVNHLLMEARIGFRGPQSGLGQHIGMVQIHWRVTAARGWIHVDHLQVLAGRAGLQVIRP